MNWVGSSINRLCSPLSINFATGIPPPTSYPLIPHRVLGSVLHDHIGSTPTFLWNIFWELCSFQTKNNSDLPSQWLILTKAIYLLCVSNIHTWKRIDTDWFPHHRVHYFLSLSLFFSERAYYSPAHCKPIYPNDMSLQLPDCLSVRLSSSHLTDHMLYIFL